MNLIRICAQIVSLSILWLLPVNTHFAYSETQNLYHSFESPQPLNQGWEISWSPVSVTNKENINVENLTLPSRWNSFSDLGLRGKGVGIYTKQVRLPSQKKPYSLYVSNVYSHGVIRIWSENGDLIGKTPEKEQVYKPTTRSQQIDIVASGVITIEMRVTNMDHPRGGILAAPIFGQKQSMESVLYVRMIRDFTLFGFLLMIAIYNFSLWSMNREAGSELYCAILGLAFSLRIFVYEDYIAKMLPDVLGYYVKHYLNYGTVYIGTVAYLFFLNSVVPLEKRNLYYGYLFFGFSLILGVFLLSFEAMTQTISFYKAYLAIIILTYLMKFSLEFVKKNKARNWIVLGNIFLLFSVVIEAIKHSMPIFGWDSAAIGFAGFMFCNSIAVSIKNFENQQEAKLKRKLQENLNTAQIVHNKMFRQDFAHSLVSLQEVYRPADALGGDWIFHYHDDENDRLYVLVGDVTGHGIASTLLTTAVLGVLHCQLISTNSGLKPTVEKIMTELNLLIYDVGNTIDRWMTCTVVCIDFKARSLRYVNAGHPPPLVKAKNKIYSLSQMSPILGESPHSKYESHERSLTDIDLISIYTDGLSEFKSERFRNPLRELRKLMETGDDRGTILDLVRSVADCNADDDISFVLLDFSDSIKEQRVKIVS